MHNRSGRHVCSQHANSILPQNIHTYVALCCVTFGTDIYVDSLKTLYILVEALLGLIFDSFCRETYEYSYISELVFFFNLSLLFLNLFHGPGRFSSGERQQTRLHTDSSSSEAEF